MRTSEIKRYTQLNELAEAGGLVIFGDSDDKNIPVCELRQAFAIQSNIYNRSFENISINEAIDLYEKWIYPLSPELVLIHIGKQDKSLLVKNPNEFDSKFRQLIAFIRSQNKKCRIAIVSLKNYNNDPQLEEINSHLKYIANSEQCDFGDIATKKVWNPKATMDTASFIYSIGFVHPLKTKRPIYDLVKIMFCYET